jgi:magnesium transporter
VSTDPKAERGVGLLDVLEGDAAASLLQGLGANEAAAIVSSLGAEEIREALLLIPRERAAAILAALSPDERERAFASLPKKVAQGIRDVYDYPQGTAGALMDARITPFSVDLTVSEALERMRTFKEKEFDAIYLMDTEGRLAGAVPLAEIVTAAPDATLGGLKRRPRMAVPAHATREDIVEVVGESVVAALPVIDADGRLVGILRHSALTGAAAELATGLQTMSGAGKDERGLSPVSFAVKRRLPWLQINLLTAFAAAAVVGAFENTIAEITALAVLLPVVAGQSGNSGMQALAVTMRALALREVKVSHWPRLLVKEAGVGLLNGIAVAVTTMAGVYLWSQSFALSAVIGIAMVVSMVIASVSGGIIPVILKAARRDPAQSSSIVLTTVTDVLGFLTFLGLATAFAPSLR